MFCCACWVTPPTVKCPPPEPPSQNRYCVIASPSASVTLNNVDAATAVLPLMLLNACVAVTVGALLTVDIVQLCQAPQSRPSNACAHNVSLLADGAPT